MSVQTEFLLIALALFLWESILWLPMRSVVLKRKWRGRIWKARMPGEGFATRELGALFLLPAPLEDGLALCQTPALFPGTEGEIFLHVRDGEIHPLGKLTWDDLKKEGHHLRVKGHKVRLTSSRATVLLSRARKQGMDLADALEKQWRLALSPSRAAREWRRWRLVSLQLRLLQPVLIIGFFIGLPLFYLFGSLLQMMLFGGWLWLLMIFIAAQLWWLGTRVYPSASGSLRMDAILALFVPFHAMRAADYATLHAFAMTHPAGLLLSTENSDHPWLAGFVRQILFPRKFTGEKEFSQFIQLSMGKHLSLESHDPAVPQDGESSHYCPRCHGLFMNRSGDCPDCPGVMLRDF